MQKQWQTAEEEALRLQSLVCNGSDEDLVQELDSMTGEHLKAVVTHMSRDGEMAFHMAAVRGRLGGLAAMLRNRVDVNAKDGNGNSALFKCLSHNIMSSAQLLLCHGADVNETVSRQTCETLLHRLVKGDRLKAVEMLINTGVSLDARTRDEETALHYAARYKRTHMALILIRAGCDVNALNVDEETPLHVAIANRATEVAKLLVKNQASMTAKDKHGMSALHTAVLANSVDLVRLMLGSASTQVNAKEHLLGRTPLLLACSHSNQKMASLLLSHGADANLTTNYRKSVLHVAAGTGNNGALGAVLKSTSNLNAIAINNKTALHYAVSARHEDVVKSLLKAGVNANLKDIDGNTALHLAAGNGDEIIVMLLLRNGVKSDVTNMKQQTALHMAFMGGHEDAGWVLVDYGSDIHAEDIHKKTPFQYREEKMLELESARSQSRLTNSEGDTSQRSVHFNDTNQEIDLVEAQNAPGISSSAVPQESEQVLVTEIAPTSTVINGDLPTVKEESPPEEDIEAETPGSQILTLSLQRKT